MELKRSMSTQQVVLRQDAGSPTLIHSGDAIKLGDIGQTMTEVGSQFVRGTVLGQGRTVLEGIEGIDKATEANERFSGFLQNQSDFIQEKVMELRGQ
jgi:hypothetical protein